MDQMDNPMEFAFEMPDDPVRSNYGELGLGKHNELRAPHCSPALVWSDRVAASAQMWADKLASEGCDLVHDDDSPYGENLAVGHSNMNEAIQDWYNEKKDYDHDAGQFSPGTGHYTQVVWKGSKELGCGEAMCQNGWEGQKVYVCRYGE